jgi:hypothetical protein
MEAARDELRQFHPGRVCPTAGEKLAMTPD